MALLLVVDDERSIRESVARYLRTLGHEVTLAENGQAALASFREHEVDLVITDINMPGGDGIEIINTLRDMGSDVPIVAMTGGGRLDKGHLLEDAALLGAVGTLEKPFDLPALRAAVEAALGEP